MGLYKIDPIKTGNTNIDKNVKNEKDCMGKEKAKDLQKTA